MVRAPPNGGLRALTHNFPTIRWPLRAAIVALLALNGIYFALQGSASKAADSAAWLVLLLLFLAETHFPRFLESGPQRLGLRGARLVAAAAVIAAGVAYIVEGNLLDAINSAAWIAIVVLLEAELRWPGRARVAFIAAAVLLYGTLAVLVIAWLLRSEWVDAYDAALWLVAYAALEMEIANRAIS